MHNTELHNTYNHKIQNITYTIRERARGNQDLIQEGLTGAYTALQSDPQANSTYILNKAKWSMINYLRKGKSVDNGYHKRDKVKIIRYDQLVFDDDIFAAALSSKGVEPLDEQVIFKIDLIGFLKRLSRNERLFIKFKVRYGLSDCRIKKILGITFCTLKAMKVNIRKEIEVSFA